MPVSVASTTAAASAAAAGGAAAARRRGEEARKRHEHCVAVDESFVSKSATVEQKRDYASCVRTLYPKPVEGGSGALEIGFLGILLVTLVLSYVLRKRVSH